MSANPKVAAQELYAVARERHIKLPKVWDEATCIRNCGAIILLHRKDGGFDQENALQQLIDKFGVDESKVKAEKAASSSSSSPGSAKRKSTADDSKDQANSAEEGKASVKAEKKRKVKKDAEDTEASPSKKVKKSDTVANEANRGIAEAIKEIADTYFKNKDMRKGGVFSKAAKAIRESEKQLVTAKDAMALPGVGKGIAAYVVEFNETGSIEKLEELRAGIA